MPVPPNRPRGAGRVAFIAKLPTIKAEIAAGNFLMTVYERHRSELGITYSSFRKLVKRYADDARLRQPTRAIPPPAPASPVADRTLIGDAHVARSEPRKFDFDPSEKPGDRNRLG